MATRITGTVSGEPIIEYEVGGVFVPWKQAIENWATVTAVTGSPTQHDYTDAQGTDWTAYEFTGAGTMTHTEGLVDVLVVNSGAMSYGGTGGNAGQVLAGIQTVSATTDRAIVVGTGVDRAATTGSAFGELSPGPRPYYSASGPCYSGGSGYQGLSQGTTTQGPGFVSSITGTSREFSRAFAVANGGNLANYEYGDGGQKNSTNPGNQTAKQGVVIVRVPSTFAQA
jgi:hypothetical protein